MKVKGIFRKFLPTQNKRLLASYSLFLIGIGVFSVVAVKNLRKKDIPQIEKIIDKSTPEVVGVQSEFDFTSFTPTPASQIPTKYSAPTPTPKQESKKNDSVSEDNSDGEKTIVKETVVVVTATPTLTPTITPTPEPTPTPTPDTSPFSVSWNKDGNKYTATASKDIKSCEFEEVNSGGPTIQVRGAGSISGNVCEVNRSNPTFPGFSMNIESFLGEVESKNGGW